MTKNLLTLFVSLFAISSAKADLHKIVMNVHVAVKYQKISDNVYQSASRSGVTTVLVYKNNEKTLEKVLETPETIDTKTKMELLGNKVKITEGNQVGLLLNAEIGNSGLVVAGKEYLKSSDKFINHLNSISEATKKTPGAKVDLKFSNMICKKDENSLNCTLNVSIITEETVQSSSKRKARPMM